MKGSPRRVGAALQIDRLETVDRAEAEVVVRCLDGPVRLGARFGRIRGEVPGTIDLELTRAIVYGRSVEALDTGLTALVTLRGAGVHHLLPGSLAGGWQVVEGADPAP
ncbi:hypothetical protein AB0K43_07440 [Kitasatospora sp. NPDC049258]|uniref:hypothetical protein n=1 Tax=Kitasatospora sp. NPDC049258 TaxID=3155394 RepID=UPI00343BCA5A